jgi:cold-inducible RNA-binding protein
MKTVFVGNLDSGATEEIVRSLFETHGTVRRVRIATDRDTGQSRGFGFVEMTSAIEAENAVAALNGREFGWRALNVQAVRLATAVTRKRMAAAQKRWWSTRREANTA